MLQLGGTFFGTCSTAAGLSSKVVDDCPGFVLYNGASVYVKFINTNAASPSDLTLNINSTGAKSIKCAGSINLPSSNTIEAGMICNFVYDGSNWVWAGQISRDTDTVPSAYCESIGTAATKIATCTNFNLADNSYIHVLFRYANSSAGALYLNINDTGAYPIYLNGQVSGQSNHTLPNGTYLAYFDGTAYQIRTDGVLPGVIAGNVKSITNEGSIITYTMGDGSTHEFAVPNTKYTAGDSINITNNRIINTGVRAVSTGGVPGTISVNTNGTTVNVAVAGLGSAAYSDSGDYAPISHSHGNISNTGTIDMTGVEIDDGDGLLISDASNEDKIVKSSLTFDGVTTNQFLTKAGTWEGAEAYSHPTYTARNEGLYKITVDNKGHVSNVKTVTKADITALGIPAQDTTYTFDGTYNASTNKAATVSSITSRISNLDGNITGTPGAEKTLTAFSEKDGIVSATFADISITKSQISDFEHTHNYAGAATAGGNALTANYAITASNAVNANKASSANTALTANYAVTAGNAVKAGNATNADSAKFATTATWAINANQAANATNAENAQNAENATNADSALYASSAGYALNADSANTAGTASWAITANNAKSALTASHAVTAARAIAAASATKATQDASGNVITDTYATKAELNSILASNDAMIFKGTLGTNGTITTVPTNNYQSGWTYRVITAGTYAGVKCEVGDLLIAISDGPTSGTTVTNAHWTVAQTNIDGAVTTTQVSSTSGAFAIFTGTSGKAIIKASTVGNATTPIYIDSNGLPQTITSYSGQANTALTANYAITAGNAINAANATNATNANKAITAGNAVYAASAGYAKSALTASNAVNAGAAVYAASAGYAKSALTASNAVNAGSAITASNAIEAAHAAEADTSLTANYAVTAGHANNANKANSADTATTASAAITASNAINAAKAANANLATTATWAIAAQYASSAGYANAANTANTSGTASWAVTASNAKNAMTANHAVTAGMAITATESVHAASANFATTATYATQNGIEYIVGTQTKSTNVWLGTTTSDALYAGKTIAYKLPFAGTSSAATLNLTLSDGSTTGSKAVILNNNTVATTHWPVNSIIVLVYDPTYNSNAGAWKTVEWNTTYSAMSAAERNGGTATTARLISASILKGADVAHAATAGSAITASNATYAETASAATTAGNAVYAASAGYAQSSLTATAAITASNAINANKANSANTATTASAAVTASNALNAANAVNAVNAQTATTASNAINAANATNATNASSAVTASAAITASNAINANKANNANNAVTASAAITASNAINAANATNATNAALATTATWAIGTQYASSAGFANSAISANTSGTSSWAVTAGNAKTALTASQAVHAASAGYALHSASANYAASAAQATHAASANYATTAGNATDTTKLPLTGGTLTGNLVLATTANGATPAIIFQRGTFTDNYNDWQIQDSGGMLYFGQRGNGSTAFDSSIYLDNSGGIHATTFEGKASCAGYAVSASSAGYAASAAQATHAASAGYSLNAGSAGYAIKSGSAGYAASAARATYAASAGYANSALNSTHAASAGYAASAAQATHAASAGYAVSAGFATKASQDASGNVITETYATKADVNSLLAGADAMVFKGTLGTDGDVTAVPTNSYQAGWTYKVITAGTYAGIKCEVGDLLIAIEDGPASGTTVTNAHWTVAQTNIDGAVTGPASATDGQVALFNGTSGKVIKAATISSGTVVTKVTLSGGVKPTLGAAITASYVTAWNAGSVPTLGAAITASYVTAWSAGSAPTLGTAIAADDITAWNAGSATVASVAQGVLTITTGTVPSLSYTARSIPNVTNAGKAASLTQTIITIPNVTSVGSAPSLTQSVVAIPNVTNAGSSASISYVTATYVKSIG